jgi:Flp pilus assembly protein TadG
VLENRDGNIAFTFGVVALPLLMGVGVGIDYVRAYNVRVKMQSDLDAALIAAVKKVDDMNESDIKDEVGKWFLAQADIDEGSYKLLLDDMVINKDKKSINAVATGVVPTTFLGLANIPTVNVSVATTVSGPSTSHIEVHMVLDKSASMMLVATSAGQTAMKNVTGNCVFACHEVEGGPYSYGGKSYATNYALAKGMGLDLRADVSVRAAKKVLSMIDAADPTHARIKVGLYTIGATAKQILAPTSSTNDALKALNDDTKKLTSATSETVSYFNNSLPALAKLVGTAGDGSTADKPLKLVLLLTDDVQSQRSWVTSNEHALVTPLNPNWCTNLKSSNATVGILYTEYLPMAWDWGYARTLNQSMKSGAFTTTWGGTIHKDVNASKTTRVAYIPYSLQDCATSTDLFISAASPDKIESGLSSLFDTYLSTVRLTQ